LVTTNGVFRNVVPRTFWKRNDVPL